MYSNNEDNATNYSYAVIPVVVLDNTKCKLSDETANGYYTVVEK